VVPVEGRTHFAVFGGFCAEPAVTQELELSVSSPLRLEHLDAREIGVQNRRRRIEDLLVQRFRRLSAHQLRSDQLKALAASSSIASICLLYLCASLGRFQRADLLAYELFEPF
jgi:hypothetical protein